MVLFLSWGKIRRLKNTNLNSLEKKNRKFFPAPIEVISFFVIAIAKFFHGLLRVARNDKKDKTESGTGFVRSEDFVASKKRIRAFYFAVF